MSVCIVGAGTAGLCSARHALSNGIKPTIFEQTGNIGGTWRYTDEIGVNQYGLNVHSSMYQNLRTNLPKEIMGFPDFPIQEQKPSYISSDKVMEFLDLFADAFNIRQHISLLHYVMRIRPYNNEWEVIVKDLSTGVIKTEYFKFVMICNGHYHTPSYPTIKGMDIFQGKAMHSHDYRCPEIYKDENVLLIGAGPSGLDLARSISKVAKMVTISHHFNGPLPTKFRSNVNQKPDVKSLNENGAFFTDNTYSSYSMILYCTGFKYNFPFLSTDCGINADDNRVKHLYKHVINIKYPTMVFIGLNFYVCAAQMMDIQARFAMAYFCNKASLPSVVEMEADTEQEWQMRDKLGLSKRQSHMLGPNQYKYFTELAEAAGIQNIRPVMVKLYNTAMKRFLNDVLNFREDIYRVIDDTTFIKIN